MVYYRWPRLWHSIDDEQGRFQVPLTHLDQVKREHRVGLNSRESEMDGKIAPPLDESRAGETLARPLDRSRARI